MRKLLVKIKRLIQYGLIEERVFRRTSDGHTQYITRNLYDKHGRIVGQTLCYGGEDYVILDYPIKDNNFWKRST